MSDLFEPAGDDKFDPTDRYKSQYMRLPLSARPHNWLMRGYAKDEHGFTRYTYSETPSPVMIPIAGHKDTSTYFLIDVCQMVAKAAMLSGDPCLNWILVADWLQAGARPELICDAIRAQIKRMGDRYDGCGSLKLFNTSVMSALERERNRL